MNEYHPAPSDAGYATRPSLPGRQAPAARRRRRGPAIHILLFAITFVTTSIAGAEMLGADLGEDWTAIREGFPFSITLMTILLCHEMGHYTLARYHRVDATLPYFIPAPFLFIGTFGAFIRMESPPPSRKALFDVGAAGPWAGVLVAIPAIMFGLQHSEIRPLSSYDAGLVFAEPPLYSILSYLTLGPLPEGMTVELHPVAIAGWFGLLVTFINLIPVGQLDGGHVSYAFLGRWHAILARLFFAIVLILAFTSWPGWILWSVLLLVVGLDHPPTLDSWVPLDRRRRIASIMTAVLFASTFMAQPIDFLRPPPTFQGDKIPISWTRSHQAPKPSSPHLLMRPAETPPKGIPL